MVGIHKIQHKTGIIYGFLTIMISTICQLFFNPAANHFNDGLFNSPTMAKNHDFSPFIVQRQLSLPLIFFYLKQSQLHVDIDPTEIDG